MPPGVDVRIGDGNPLGNMWIGDVPVKWMIDGDGNLLFSDYRNDIPQLGSAVFLEQVDYEVSAVGRRIGSPIEWTGINASARAFKNLKCRLDWHWTGAQEVWTQVLTPGNITLPLPDGTENHQHYVFAHPDPGRGVPTPYRISVTNPDGPTFTQLGAYAVWRASDRREIVGLAVNETFGRRQVPGTPGSVAAHGYFEINTDAIVRKVEVIASDGQVPHGHDQTSHLIEGYVTGSRTGVYNAGYRLTTGASYTFVERSGVWDPSFRVKIYVTGEANAVYDVSEIRLLQN